MSNYELLKDIGPHEYYKKFGFQIAGIYSAMYEYLGYVMPDTAIIKNAIVLHLFFLSEEDTLKPAYEIDIFDLIQRSDGGIEEISREALGEFITDTSQDKIVELLKRVFNLPEILHLVNAVQMMSIIHDLKLTHKCEITTNNGNINLTPKQKPE